MAERSCAKEVELLRLGAGTDFRGEGILAVTMALLQSGVGKSPIEEIAGTLPLRLGTWVLASLRICRLLSRAAALAVINQPSQPLPAAAHARAI